MPCIQVSAPKALRSVPDMVAPLKSLCVRSFFDTAQMFTQALKKQKPFKRWAITPKRYQSVLTHSRIPSILSILTLEACHSTRGNSGFACLRDHLTIHVRLRVYGCCKLMVTKLRKDIVQVSKNPQSPWLPDKLQFFTNQHTQKTKSFTQNLCRDQVAKCQCRCKRLCGKATPTARSLRKIHVLAECQLL